MQTNNSIYKSLGVPVEINSVLVMKLCLFGERAKRARRYLLMSMESRDIYIYTYACF